ncbi:MAG: hypothetical protein HY741_24215 [Chloroflexi bacterium]|nr:hypothetical protein [Chloroflexota bacterium]
MIVLELHPELVAELKSEAARRETTLDMLVNDWLREQLWREKHKKIQEEAERFRAQHAELVPRYRGRYIAMREGQVIDDDADLVTLHQRIRAQYGNAPILMTPVTTDPIQTFRVLGARRHKAQA